MLTLEFESHPWVQFFSLFYQVPGIKLGNTSAVSSNIYLVYTQFCKLAA